MIFKNIYKIALTGTRRAFSTGSTEKRHKGAVFGIGSFLGLGLLSPFVYSYGKVISRDIPVCDASASNYIVSVQKHVFFTDTQFCRVMQFLA